MEALNERVEKTFGQPLPHFTPHDLRRSFATHASGLGIQPHDIDSTVYNLLMERGVSARDVIFPTGIKNLDLLPSNIDLSGAEVQLVSEVGREFVLGRALDLTRALVELSCGNGNHIHLLRATTWSQVPTR